MGNAADVEFLKTKQARVSTKLLIDVPILVTVIILLILGLLFLYSASWNFALQEYDNAGYIVIRQAFGWYWIGSGLILTFMDYHFY